MHEKFLHKRVQLMKQNEQRMLTEHGWYVHYVFETDKNEFGGLANIHTHGLKENFNHPDIQVVMPIASETVHPVLVGLVEDIKRGETFKENERSSKVLRGMDVYFAPFKENGRDVLRLILPDPQGRLPLDDGCDEIYKQQMNNIEI